MCELQDSDRVRKNELIAAVKTKLSTFSGPLSSRVKVYMSSFDERWKDLSDDNKKRALDILNIISLNIEAFGNAGEDPVAAAKAAINIIAPISSNYATISQSPSLQAFVSALLGLFGKGPKPKTFGAVVGEQIKEALSKYRDQELSLKKDSLLSAFQRTKAYLDRAAGGRGNLFLFNRI
ncbi:uncharacterized protein LOC114575189 [Exaiptasia diaphana]|uniref:Uncharacterized protein n=1 Tax=Exaiptasia diaphana TaxID=2652724 RepID=A0A913YJR2_EXADI|nr:uncharacterized protein LOC114575189 [Exaiptasia diaphana]